MVVGFFRLGIVLLLWVLVAAGVGSVTGVWSAACHWGDVAGKEAE